MSENKTSILLSDVSIEGDLVEKDKLILDAKVSGDIKAEEIITLPAHQFINPEQVEYMIQEIHSFYRTK